MTDRQQTDMFLNQPSDIEIDNQFQSDNRITLFCGDRLELLEQIRDTGSKAELIVTSPPYNVGKEYEEVKELDAYIADQQKTIKACVEILSSSGSICWQVGHYIEDSGRSKEAFPLDLVLYPIFKELGLKLRNRIVWTFGHGLHEKYRLTGRHETILWFTHDTEDYTFNLDPIRVPQKYPGKRKYRGKDKGKISGNRLGKNPEDVWDMPNVKSNHAEKTDHPCQFPIGLVERLVLGLTNEDDLVVDPYIGVGTTSVASILHNRRSAGSDTESNYLDIARKRCHQAANGTVPYRPMNKAIHKPNPKSKVAQIPSEWKEE